MTTVTSLSETKRRLLHSYLQGGAPLTAAPSSIIGKSSGEPAPLSFSQEQLVLREYGQPNIPPLYNECITLRMKGELDIAALERSLAEIIHRHEIWRTSYVRQNGRLVQVVSPASANVPLELIDLGRLPRNEQDQTARQIVYGLATQSFDLASGPLLRARLIRLSNFEHRLYLIAHLSIVDGVSVYQVFPRELATLYRAFISGQPSPLHSLPIQFADYACWQRQWSEGEEWARQTEYWRNQLSGELPALNWPNDRLQLCPQTFRGTIRSCVLPGTFRTALKNSSHQEGITSFMELAAVFAVLMQCYTEQDDIIIGTPSPAGRKRSQVQSLLGHFLNPVALRFDLSGDPSFRKVLRQAQKLILEAISNDDVPIELLAQQLRPNSDLGRNPLFRVAISLQPSMPELGLEWSMTSMDVDSGGSPWELYIAFIDIPEGMMGRIQYNPDVFDSSTIIEMIQDFQQLLVSLTANPLGRISEAKRLVAKPICRKQLTDCAPMCFSN